MKFIATIEIHKKNSKEITQRIIFSNSAEYLENLKSELKSNNSEILDVFISTSLTTKHEFLLIGTVQKRNGNHKSSLSVSLVVLAYDFHEAENIAKAMSYNNIETDEHYEEVHYNLASKTALTDFSVVANIRTENY